MLDLLKKKGNCSENKSVEQLDGNRTTDLCLCCCCCCWVVVVCFFVCFFAKTVFFSLDAAHNQFYFSVRCALHA